jgi:hypothetical protein
VVGTEARFLGPSDHTMSNHWSLFAHSGLGVSTLTAFSKCYTVYPDTQPRNLAL